VMCCSVSGPLWRKSVLNLLRHCSRAYLPELNFPYEHLEPALSHEIVRLHHDSHHRAYVSNYNKLMRFDECKEIEKIDNDCLGI
ncbi:MAG: hypothetical protein MHPSP_003015, partial [Paramarteilia canceri]